MRIEDEIHQSRFRNENHKLVVNLMLTSSWLNIRQIQFFRSYDLSPQQFNVLRILRGQHPKPASVNLLMERMIDKTSNASRLVDKLEAKGLVHRTTCKEDRRKADVFLSETGVELLSQIDTDLNAFEKELIGLGEAEARELNAMLDKLRDK